MRSDMKAAVCTGLNQMSVERYPDPEVSDPEGMVIRVHTCSVCGSDLRIFHHGNPRVKPPQILGHEIAGEVVAVGANVHRFKVGDRVAVAPTFRVASATGAVRGSAITARSTMPSGISSRAATASTCRSTG